MDLFEKYLTKIDSSWVQRALTDKSYKNEYCKLNHIEYNEKTNEDLATYGDAVIKLCYLELMLDKEQNLSKEKEKVESDEYLVKVVAKHYDLRKYIKIDSSDSNIKKDYDYINPKKTKGGNKKDSPHKYIATAVEAMIGAIYKEKKDLKRIMKLLDSWRKLNVND